jgi:agmatinase
MATERTIFMTMPLTDFDDRAQSFISAPVQTDLANLEADIAVLGVPYGTPYGMSGVSSTSSSAPAAIREASARAGRFLHHYDYDLGGPLLNERELRIIDCGDVPGDPLDIPGNVARARAAVESILKRGAVPVVLGGDDSIPIPVLRAYEKYGPIVLVQIDAHIDFRDELDGVTEGYSSPIRRASEMAWVDSIVQIGMRGVGSARPSDVHHALTAGNSIITAREVHDGGAAVVLNRIPEGASIFVTLDCDGLDPSIMPAVGAPAPGGLTYYQTVDILHGLAQRGRIAGMDIVELVPSIDVNGISSLTASRLILNLMGAMARSGQFQF